MKLPRWLGGKRHRSAGAPEAYRDGAERPLREFVYLDEVSLRSLLSSQKGEVTDTTSEQSVAANQAEIGSGLGVSAGILAKAEITSRYQTSNSSTLQTSRKATVQSWFREFHNLSDLRILEPQAGVSPFVEIDDIRQSENTSISIPAADLHRGELVEFRVRLTADPVFRFGTLMSEFTGMADESPTLFAGNNTFAILAQTVPVNRILQRLLAGLIPIRAKALDQVVATVDGSEYVVHRDAIAGLGLETRPLEIVGVTEHLAYWKDIRRVLFSEAEFTMLCRVGRDGLQDTWTPVKLAALFLPHAPDLIDQINAASRSSLEDAGTVTVSTNEILLGRALAAYKADVLLETTAEIDEEQHRVLDEAVLALRSRHASATAQRSAFSALKALLHTATSIHIDGTRDLELRDRARDAAGLPMFPSLSQGTTWIDGTNPTHSPPTPRLLDVEVVAIYW